MDLPVEGEKGPETRAGSLADRNVATCGLDERVADVSSRLAGARVCVVVRDGVVMGVLEGDSLAGGTLTAAEAMRRGPSTFRPSISPRELATYLGDHDMDHTVITTLDGRLVGTVSRADLERAAGGDG
ncbi:MAG TPA: CBS domain-containing protein [Acidimicrobiales bacterium]|jgi:CBS domain-containing protein|nr:CBS domain-containing protein [Acidimicrobiales bacterium]